MSSGSFLEFVLGSNGAHSTLARSGAGVWSFAAGQAFTLVDAGAQPGLYRGLITGLGADPGGESAWTITGGQFAGTFSYDGAGDINLSLRSAVPEPATWLGGAAAGLLGLGACLRQRRSRPPGGSGRWMAASPARPSARLSL